MRGGEHMSKSDIEYLFVTASCGDVEREPGFFINGAEA